MFAWMFWGGFGAVLLLVGLAAYALFRRLDRAADRAGDNAFPDDPGRARTFALLWRVGGPVGWHGVARGYARTVARSRRDPPSGTPGQ